MKSIYSGSGMPPFMDAVEAFEQDLRRRRLKACRILAVDPGVLTGVFVLWFDPKTGEILGWGTTMITHDEIKQVWSLMTLLRQLADHGRVWLVIEDFTVDQVNMSPAFLSPVRVGRRFEFGAEILAGGQLGIGPVFGSIELPVVWNSRSRKADYDDARLKKMGMFTPGPDHTRDATRHGLVRWKQLKLELPFTVTEADDTPSWDPWKEEPVGVRLGTVTRSFNGKPTGSHGQPGKKGVTKDDMARIKLHVGGKANGKWEAMAEQMIAFSKTGAKVGLMGENKEMPSGLKAKVATETGLQWVPLPDGRGWVLEHDPKTQSGIMPAQRKTTSPDVQKSSPKAKKRIIRRLA